MPIVHHLWRVLVSFSPMMSVNLAGNASRAGGRRLFFLGTGCGLLPNSIPYNVWQMAKAVGGFGWFAAH